VINILIEEMEQLYADDDVRPASELYSAKHK
jgi:hypothetical protein